jgi:hypothetical protein
MISFCSAQPPLDNEAVPALHVGLSTVQTHFAFPFARGRAHRTQESSMGGTDPWPHESGLWIVIAGCPPLEPIADIARLKERGGIQ